MQVIESQSVTHIDNQLIIYIRKLIYINGSLFEVYQIR